jgi:DNA-binding CsgD family transcriptional regulator
VFRSLRAWSWRDTLARDGEPTLLLASSLFERGTDLAALAGRVAALRDRGEGHAVLIEGPPGIGKSALLHAALAEAEGVETLRARGSELEADLAFGGVRQLFTAPLRRLPAAERQALLEGPAGLAARALGMRGAGAAGSELSDPLYGLYWLAADLAERKPLILAIDDLHWLDEESGRFVSYLARRLEGVPLLVIATARPDEPGARTPLTTLADAGSVVRPAPLTRDAIAALLPDRPAHAVHAVTGGNPLLVMELARADPDVALEDVGPTSVARSVLQRVERLSQDAVALARAVALFGAGASLGDAASVASLDSAAAAAAADGLVAATVLSGTDVLTFVHPLMRTAVYDDLGPHARRAGHARAAAVLRDRGAAVEEVAAHVLAGEPSGDPADLAVLREAARRATAAIAPRAALRYLERALLEPIPPGAERAALLRYAGRLQATLGRAESAETLQAALDAADDPLTRFDIALELATVHDSHGRGPEAIDLLEPFLGTELDPERALTLDAMLAACATFAGGPRATFQAAIARIPDDLPGDTAAQRFALLWKAWGGLADAVPVAATRELAHRALRRDEPSLFGELGSQLEDPYPVLLACGDLDTMEALAEERMAKARETGSEAAFAWGQLALATALQQRGYHRRAEAEVRAYLDHPAQTAAGREFADGLLVETLVNLGRLHDAEAILDALEAGGVRDDTLVGVRRAQFAAARGDWTLYAAFKRPVERFEALGLSSAAVRRWLCPYAYGLACCGGHDEAVGLMEDYVRSALLTGEPAAIGEGLTTLGRLKHGEEAIEALEQACEVLAASPFRWLNGRAELELGSALRRAGQRVRARDRLRSALDYAEHHGDALIATRAREELRVTGARLRRTFVSGVESLTPAEMRVARLAADRLSNREIAQQLFLTRKTVEMHVSRCLRKLDISSRAELPDALGDAA